MSRSLHESVRHPASEEATRPGPVYRPDADILELSDAYLVRVDVPGADEQTVQVRFEKDILSIHASPGAAAEPSGAARYAEYRPGGYAREFRLADGIDVDGIRASLRHGVLELRLPKTGRRRSRAIEVAAA